MLGPTHVPPSLPGSAGLEPSVASSTLKTQGDLRHTTVIERLFLGLDLGSTTCKAVIFTETGRPAGRGHSTYGGARSQHGAVEQDPEVWWNAATVATRAAVSGLSEDGQRPSTLAGIGLSGQVGTQVLLDRNCRAIRPAISWQDTRAGRHAQDLVRRVGRKQLEAELGIDLPPSPSWPLPRLLWLRDNEPQALESSWRFAQPKDYVLFRLTGELATDAYSWRGLVHLPDGILAVDLLADLGLPTDLLPRVLSPSGVAGTVIETAAAELSIPSGVPVVVGWHDFSCALLGAGVTASGQGFDLAGTSEHVGVAVKRRLSDKGGPGPQPLILAPYLPANESLETGASSEVATHVLYGATSAAGRSLSWFEEGFLPGLQGPSPSYPRTSRGTDLAAGVPAGSDGVIFLPYLGGERAPIWDSEARGVFFGLGSEHGSGHLARAVLEGVAFSVRHVLEAAEARVGWKASSVTCTGGPSRASLWNKIKADVLNRPLMITKEPESSCLGAAILAAVGVGHYDCAVDAAAVMVHPPNEVLPSPTEASTYDDMFRIYLALYPNLRQSFADLAAVRGAGGSGRSI